MKKKSIVIFISVLLITLSSCAQSGYVNLSVFIENYNKINENPISFTDFSGSYDEKDNNVYSLEIKEGENLVLVKLIDENKNIKECRIILSKYDNNLDEKVLTDEYWRLFMLTSENVIVAYTGLMQNEYQNMLDDISANRDVPELTASVGNFNFIYLSNELCCEFIIRNKWLNETETTQKPENKNSFSNSTSIRTETVPHR